MGVSVRDFVAVEVRSEERRHDIDEPWSVDDFVDEVAAIGEFVKVQGAGSDLVARPPLCHRESQERITDGGDLGGFGFADEISELRPACPMIET